MGWTDNNGVYHRDAGDPQDPGATYASDFAQWNANPEAYMQTHDGKTPAYLQNAPDTPWSHIVKPSAFQYGGHTGAAQAAENRYQGLAAAADNRQGPQQNLANVDADMMRSGQRGYDQDYALGQYSSLMNGTNAPTAAQRQLQQGYQQGLQQTASQVAGARGGGNALVAAQAAGADAGARQSGAYSMASRQLQAQQQLGAMQAYGDAASQARAQDQQQAGIYGQTATNQAQLDMGQRSLNDQRNAEYEKMRRDVFNDQMTAQQTGEATNAQAQQSAAKRQAASDAAGEDTKNAIVTGAMVAGSALLSDVRAKKDIRPAGGEVDQAMDAMSPYGYQYKQPEKYGQGQQVGPMAQDLAATPAGRTAIVKAPDGKLAIDQGQGTKLSLAGIARLNERVRALEGGQPVDRNPGGVEGTKGYRDFKDSQEYDRNPGGLRGTPGYDAYRSSVDAARREEDGQAVLPYRAPPPVKQINVPAPHRETATEQDPHIVDISHMGPDELEEYKRARAAIMAGKGTGADASYVVQQRARGTPLPSGQAPPEETASAAPAAPLKPMRSTYGATAKAMAKEYLLGGYPNVVRSSLQNEELQRKMAGK